MTMRDKKHVLLKKIAFANKCGFLKTYSFKTRSIEIAYKNGTDRTQKTKIAVNIKEENYICLRQKVSVYQR